jgi:hypothetical protein
MSYADKAQRYLDVLKLDQRHDKDIVICMDMGSREYKELSEVLHKMEMSMGSVWMFAWEALHNIVDSDPQTREGLEDDLLDNIEADIYTADLISWLAESLEHTYYVDDILKSYPDMGDIAKVLTYAQYDAKKEVFMAVVRAVLEN